MILYMYTVHVIHSLVHEHMYYPLMLNYQLYQEHIIHKENIPQPYRIQLHESIFTQSHVSLYVSKIYWMGRPFMW